MSNTAQKMDKFHDTRQGKFVFGLVELVAAYLFTSLAIDSGAIWQYVLAIIFLVGGVRNVVNAFRVHNHVKSKRQR